MLADSIQAMIREGESELVEFKSSLPPTPIIARNLAAFANARGGVLLLGVGEHPSPRAVGVDADRAEAAVRRAAESLTPLPEVRTSRVVIDGVEVVVAEVSATRHLTLAPDGLFVRVGDFNRPFTPSEAVERLSSAGGEGDREDAANLAQAVARLTEQLEAQKPLLVSLTKANHWSRKLLWVVLGAVAGASAKELLPLLLG